MVTPCTVAQQAGQPTGPDSTAQIQGQDAAPGEAAPDQAAGAQPTPSSSVSANNDNPQSQNKSADQNANSSAAANQTTLPGQQQPKRILGVMPNFRAVSAGALPPPPTPKESFLIATQNSFDYSSFIFVGITSMLAEGTNAHPALGKGLPGFGRYYWRGFLDKTDGNYLVIFALPSLFHQDERYYALGKGSFWKRFTYSGTRVFVTPNYHGENSFNISELLGRGISQGVSLAYYPSGTRTVGALSQK